MRDLRQLMVLCVASKTRQRLTEEVKDLRRGLLEEKKRAEHARIVRIRHYVTVSCLSDPPLAPWMYIWEFGNDENAIAVTSLCRRSFNQLLERFSSFYEIPRFNPKGGRPRKLRHHHQALGVVMAFYVDAMTYKSLCSYFGVPHATLSRVLNDAEAAMERTLVGFAPARIVWLTLKRQKALAQITASREPLMQFTWGFLDGKNYPVLEPPDRDLQNAHYNGWLHAVFVTGTLCFGADGLIVWGKHNCPGSWNDADTSLEFRQKLIDSELNPDPRYGVVSDSAFPCGGDMVGRILAPLKEGDLERLVPSVRQVAQRMSSAITSVRQAAEWGMGSIEKVFHRLLHPLPYDVAKRKQQLDNLFRLSNYRVRSLEVSQIRTTFVHWCEDNA